MFDRILVGTDFSDRADDAVRLASRLLSPSARLRLVHVVPSQADWEVPGVQTALASDAEQAEERLQRAAKERTEGSVEWAVLRGDAGRAIAADAQAWSADLVVVGARGSSRLTRAILGAVARTVLRRSRRSVLVARPGRRTRDGPVRRVLVATDFHAASDAAGRVAQELAGRLEADVVALHANDPAIWGSAMDAGLVPGHGGVKVDIEREIRARLTGFNDRVLAGRAKEIVAEGRPARRIVEHARRIGADLVIVGTHGAGPIERAVLGSVAEGVAERAACSVLVVQLPPGAA